MTSRDRSRSPRASQEPTCVVKLRGLPYSCTKEEVATFFLGLPIAPHGITLLEDRSTGRPNGDGFVEFINPEIVEKALEKHRDSIQHRYIEVYRSSLEELERYLRRAKRCSSPTRGQVDMIRENSPDTRRNQDSYRGPVIRDDRSRRGGPLIRDKRTQNRQVDVRSGLCVYLRGLPFSATKRDVEEFLEPAVPNKVVIELTNGRPNGNAIVSLSNQRDVNICLRKHRLNMELNEAKRLNVLDGVVIPCSDIIMLILARLFCYVGY